VNGRKPAVGEYGGDLIVATAEHELREQSGVAVG
jgi:hypothetical protein